MVGKEYKLRDNQGKFQSKEQRNSVILTWAFIVAFVLLGIVFGVLEIVKWANTHEIKTQSPVRVSFHKLVWVEEIKPIILSPVVEPIIVEPKEFTPVEQKIIDRWGYKDGVMAIAIFDCGESGLDTYAVSHTGDLGIAQINWATWKNPVADEFGYNAADMFNEDKNLDVGYWVWDRGDGEVGNGKGTWEAWTGFTNGSYLRCFK